MSDGLNNKLVLKIVFIALIISFFILAFLSCKNINSLFQMGFSNSLSKDIPIYVGYSQKSIHPNYEAAVEARNSRNNSSLPQVYKDAEGHFVLPLEGFGNSYGRKGYSECMYDYYDSASGSYKCSNDSTYSNPLKETTVVFYDGKKYVIMIGLDSINFPEWTLKQLRDEIYKMEGLKDIINVDNSIINVSATHAHSTPGFSFLTESNKNNYPDLYYNIYYYKLFVYSQIKASISEAINNLYEASLSYSSIDVKDDNNRTLNFIRHYNTLNTYKNGDKANRDDNHGNYAWDGSHYIANNNYDDKHPHVADPDTTMQLLKVEYSDSIKREHNIKNVLLINWQAHPVSVGGSAGKVISADYVGDLRKYLANQPDFSYNIAYFNGGAGDLNDRTFLTHESDEALVNKQYSDVVAVSMYSNKNKVEASIEVGSKLGEFVLEALNNNTFKKVNVDEIEIDSQKFKYMYKDKIPNDSILYNNAYYIYKLHMASIAQFKDMVEGTYNWNDSYFNINFDLINYSEHGPELAKLLLNVSESNELSKVSGFGTNVYTINQNSSKPSGYEMVMGSGFVQGTKNSLLNIIGVDLDNLETDEDERIYSRVHGSRIVEVNKKHEKDEDPSLEVEINAISMGDFSFATLPNEPFSSIGINIKRDTKSSMTFVLGYTNGDNGYLPDEAAFTYGSYEADNSIYKKGTAEAVQNKLINMIKDISIKKVEISKLPSKLTYLQDIDNLDLSGGKIKVTYANGSSEEVDMNSLNSINIEGFDNTKLGRNRIFINYLGQSMYFDIAIDDGTKKITIDYDTTDNPDTYKEKIITIIIMFVLLIVIGLMLNKIRKKIIINKI